MSYVGTHHSFRRSRISASAIGLACVPLLAGTLGVARAAGTEALSPVALAAAQAVGPTGHAHARFLKARRGDVIPDQYIVVFLPGTSPKVVKSAEKDATKLGGKVGFTYTRALQGFSANLPAQALASLQRNASVDYIEPDQVFSASTVEPSPPLGLDRTSERLLLTSIPSPPVPVHYPLDDRYTYSQSGVGVNAYVIDTGIRISHHQFDPGRASYGFTAIAPDANDCNGHGTHVAGTIGGADYGIAKNVTLHAVRVLDCSGSGTASGVIAGVDWVTANAVHPAVANMSLGGPPMPSVDTAVANSIASGITYAVAAGNNYGFNACAVSPAAVPSAITVGAMNPMNDTVSGFSNAGTCIDLFAPGENILSSWNTDDLATNVLNGTSMATPHVAGVAALWLEVNQLATPAMVWNHLHTVTDDVATTPSWPGLIGLTAGSPNELLHYGSVSQGMTDGDPHIHTVDGLASYGFQPAGEFVALRDGNGMQIQTRQVPVATTVLPGFDAYTGLNQCVSLNDAVAAKVGTHRVTYEPNLSGIPDPTNLQLRIDGVLTTLPPGGINLSGGGRVAPAVTTWPGGIEVDFPDGSVMNATSRYWTSQGLWYITAEVFNSSATEGIMGPIELNGWLPGMPDGTFLGPKPSDLHARFVQLNQTFGDAWRVTNATSLFDYAAGTSTATFTVPGWPVENGPCLVPGGFSEPVTPLDKAAAVKACKPVKGEANGDCVFDVVATANPEMVQVKLAAQQLAAGATRIELVDPQDTTTAGDTATFVVNVSKLVTGGKRAVPLGQAQLSIDGQDVGTPVVIDRKGNASLQLVLQKPGVLEVQARYLPSDGSPFLASTSELREHTVK